MYVSRRRRVRGVEVRLVDIARSDLTPVLAGADVLLHLASVVDPVPDEALMARVNVDGARRVLDAAAAVGISKVIRVSGRGGLRRVGDESGAAHRGRAAAPEPGVLTRDPGRRGRAAAR